MIEVGTIENLRAELDDELVGQLVELFLESSPNVLRKMRSAFQARNTKALHEESHALKSSSASLGAAVMASFCQEIETLTAQPGADFEFLEALIVKLEGEYACVAVELKAV